MNILIKVVGTILFIIVMFFYVRYAHRKAVRDYSNWEKAEREHEQWMVDFGRSFPRRKEE